MRSRRSFCGRWLAGTGLVAGTVLGVGELRSRWGSFELVETVESDGDLSSDSWNEIHVDMVAADRATAGDTAFAGVRAGLDHLEEGLGEWFGGYRLRTLESDASLSCWDEQGEQLEEIAEAVGGTDRLVHVVHDCTRHLSRSGCTSCRRVDGTGWGDTGGVTSVSRANRLYGSDRYRVRAFHHLLHGFLTGTAAREAATLPESVSAYDAEHRLGTVTASGRRTVMADRWSYRDDAAAGDCGADRAPATTRWPNARDLTTSECTREALRLAALDARP